LKPMIESASRREMILAPMRGADLLSAIKGLREGDLVICRDGAFRRRLEREKLAAASVLLGTMSVVAVSRRPFSLADLGRSDWKIGGGKASGPLGETLKRALPPDMAGAIWANIGFHSERTGELLRLLDLGGLDAVLVWETPKLAEKYRLLRFASPGDRCDVFLVRLACSRLPRADAEAVLRAARSAEATAALQACGVRTVRRDRGRK